MKYRWVSFYHEEKMGPFTLYYPWWISGYRMSDDAATVVVAVPVTSKQKAYDQIRMCFDKKPRIIAWRFNELKVGSPFSERFPRAAWMSWPERVGVKAGGKSE